MHTGQEPMPPWPWQTVIATTGAVVEAKCHGDVVKLGGDLSIRLFKGFNLNVGGEYGAIRNQLYLPAVSATPEEILTQRGQLATRYQYLMFAGLSYTFGSVLNASRAARLPTA